MRPMITDWRTRAYQFSLRTGKPRTMCSASFAQRPMPGIAVARARAQLPGAAPPAGRRYGGDVAVLLGLAIVLAVSSSRGDPGAVVLLPLALSRRAAAHRQPPDLAISAVAERLVARGSPCTARRVRARRGTRTPPGLLAASLARETSAAGRRGRGLLQQPDDCATTPSSSSSRA